MEYLQLMMADNRARQVPVAPTAVPANAEEVKSPANGAAATAVDLVYEAGSVHPVDLAEPVDVMPNTAPVASPVLPLGGEPQAPEGVPGELLNQSAPSLQHPAAGTREQALAQVMDALARRTCTAPSQGEALALAGALVPLAIRLAVHDEVPIWAAAPGMLRAAAEMVHSLYDAPAYRSLLVALPKVLTQAAERLEKLASDGHRLSPRQGYLAVTRSGEIAITSSAGWLEDAAWEASCAPARLGAPAQAMYRLFVE